LVVGKVDLALTVDQQNRQDLAHLKILLLCVRGFLRELLAQVEQGNVPVKAWLGAVNRLLKLAKTKLGRQAAKKLGVQWSEVLPMTEILLSSNAKITLFREKQLLARPIASNGFCR
jgi:hypothetical protein